ncbi:MFS transporter permease [Microbacterium sp. P04]|uniref:MFS transporter permease n=1 Tax=Microbacterium sp. P04 TaxID=3366947 RepID=UPI0037476518
MWLRRLFFRWQFPAAVVLPLWLLVGWGVFQEGGWAFLWVLFIAIPSVFLGEIALTLLVRARGTVRVERAVSWWDVAGFTAWHVLIIATGFYNPVWFAPTLLAATAVGLGLFGLSLTQLWRETRVSSVLLRTPNGIGYIPPTRETRRPAAPADVIVLEERDGRA